MDLAKIRKKARASASSRQQPPEEGPAPAETPPRAGKAKRAPREPAPPPAEDPVPAPAENAQTLEPTLQDPSAAPPPGMPQEASVPGDGRSAVAGEKLLIFDLEEEKYAIPIHDIAQIIETPPTTPIPNSPAFLYGILSLRGKIVSIIDVAARLDLKRCGEARKGKIVVLDLGADQFGLLVDDIDQVVEVDLSALEPPPEGFRPMAQDFVEGVFHHRQKAVAFLNLPMFLAFEI